MPNLMENALSFVEDLRKSVSEKAESWSDLYIEESLDSRDIDPFDSEWIMADKSIQSVLIEESTLSRIEEIEKNTFLSIIHATGSDDLAGYVAEDFALIACGLAVSYSSDFFFSLINAYIKGRIPDNSMEMIESNPTGLY